MKVDCKYLTETAISKALLCSSLERKQGRWMWFFCSKNNYFLACDCLQAFKITSLAMYWELHLCLSSFTSPPGFYGTRGIGGVAT